MLTLILYVPASVKNLDPYNILEQLHQNSMDDNDRIVIDISTDCWWKVWYGSRTTCTVSIETVALLQNSSPAECTHSTFLCQETSSFSSRN